MYKKIILGSVLIFTILLIACSDRKEINIDDTKIFKEELESNFKSIKVVDVTFKRPGLTFDIDLEKLSEDEDIVLILKEIKEFVNSNKIDEISKRYNSNKTIQYIYIKINEDGDKSTIEKAYQGDYRNGGYTFWWDTFQGVEVKLD